MAFGFGGCFTMVLSPVGDQVSRSMQNLGRSATSSRPPQSASAQGSHPDLVRQVTCIPAATVYVCVAPVERSPVVSVIPNYTLSSILSTDIGRGPLPAFDASAQTALISRICQAPVSTGVPHRSIRYSVGIVPQIGQRMFRRSPRAYEEPIDPSCGDSFD